MIIFNRKQGLLAISDFGNFRASRVLNIDLAKCTTFFKKGIAKKNSAYYIKQVAEIIRLQMTIKYGSVAQLVRAHACHA